MNEFIPRSASPYPGKSTMRLYRGLKEPFQPGKIGREQGPMIGTDFTDCPYTALQYARGRRGAVLIADVPADDSCWISEEDWFNRKARRLMVWGTYHPYVVAVFSSKELRAQVRQKGIAAKSDEYKAMVLRDYINRKLIERRFSRDGNEASYVSPHTEVRAGWESWSTNGEALIDDRISDPNGSSPMSDHLTWVVREYASRARRVYKACGTIPFAFEARRTPPTIAWAFTYWFDLALMDHSLVEERMRQRGAMVASDRCPSYWLERKDFVLAAEAHEVCVPVGSTNAASEKWEEMLKAMGRIDRKEVVRALSIDEKGFIAGIIVAAHEQPTPSKRPTKGTSLRLHQALLSRLAPAAEKQGYPITWSALLRMPPGLKTGRTSEETWMRFPAVSFIAAAFPIDSTRGGFESYL